MGFHNRYEQSPMTRVRTPHHATRARLPGGTRHADGVNLTDHTKLAATVSEDSDAVASETRHDLEPGTQVADRFVVGQALGRGSSGEVVTVHDLALDRDVAMKVLRGAGGPTIARFVREARVTARLDHPNVPPVHTLEFLPDGGLIFTMRKLEGATLGDALRRSIAGDEQPAIATVNNVVNLALRICDALARAHHCGIVHRDIKPDNIMLGPHGEVALVDWGECRLLSEPDPGLPGSTIGTPAYMSPEQARGEPADQRSDLYGVATTFWHVLTRQVPTWAESPETFWERKRRGEIDPLQPAAAARVPRRLLAILRRALEPDPSRRYASARELADELERFQGGLAITAYRETSLERVGRWLRRHRGPLLAATVILAIAATAGGLLWREHLRQVGDWGEPILSEAFVDGLWETRWTAWPEAGFTNDSGSIRSTAQYHGFLLLNRPLSGAVAIEYDGWFGPGSRPGDLSIVWHEDTDLLKHPQLLWSDAPKPHGFWIQAGSYSNNFCSIFSWPDGRRLDKSPLRLDPAKRHRFRVELDGRLIRMWVDGQPTLQYEALLPISTGHLGLYSYYPGKHFANLRVYQKRLPEMAPMTHAADVLLDRKLYPAAAEEYAKVVASHAGRPLAREALYRQGLAQWLAGRRDEAEALWADLPPGEQADRAAGHRLDRQFEGGRLTEACAGLVELYRRAPAVGTQLRDQWSAWAHTADENRWVSSRPGDVTALIEAKLAAFPDHDGTAQECASLMNNLDRPSEALERFPDETLAAAWAMIKVGRATEAAERFANTSWLQSYALIEAGDFAPLLTGTWPDEDHVATAAVQSGQAAAWLGRLTTSRARLLLGLGRADEALADARATSEERASALWQLGRQDEAALAAEDCRDVGVRVRLDLLRGIAPQPIPERPDGASLDWLLADAAVRGDAAAFARMRMTLARTWPNWEHWIAWLVTEPTIALRAGDPDLLRQRLAQVWPEQRHCSGQRAWHLAGYVLGKLDAAAMRRMPCQDEADLWIAIGDALRLALDGKPAAAAWQRYLAKPPQVRCLDHMLPDPGLERLATWLASEPSVPPSAAPAR